jgi:hypothetical protein
MPDPMLDTASQRPPTGLNAAARRLIMQVVDWPAADMLSWLFMDRHAGIADYVETVGEVWGSGAATNCKRVVDDAMADPVLAITAAGHQREGAAEALLLAMPEPDFRLAIHESLTRAAFNDPGAHGASEARITRICKSRGAPWAYTLRGGFEYVGDEEIERTAVRPALSAVGDPRFSGGVKDEFDSARAELSVGTPKALSQSVHQSGCSVESAMKVVLDERGVGYAASDAAYALFEALVDATILPRSMEKIILGAATPRNKKGGHGAGAQPHAVASAEAETVFANAAVAITYLHSLLP